ncbi:DUF2080 family transposase-associated protein [Natronomonas sp.]
MFDTAPPAASDVKATGNGAHVYVPKRWRGADVKVVRTSDLTTN